MNRCGISDSQKADDKKREKDIQNEGEKTASQARGAA